MFGIIVSWNDAEDTETTELFFTKESMFKYVQELIHYEGLTDENIVYFVTYSKDEIERDF